MRFVLVDDNASALELLMERAAATAEHVTALWVNHGNINLTSLGAIRDKMTGVGKNVEVVQVRSAAELATKIKELAACEHSPSVLCSDLNLDPIGQKVDGNKKCSWKYEENAIRGATKVFAANSKNLACLYSSDANISATADSMGGPSARIFALSKNMEFTDGGGLERADALLSEIFDKLSLCDQTPLEKLWEDTKVKAWFSGDRTVRHEWLTASEDYKKRISAGLKSALPRHVADLDLPASFWTESFHESLKGIAGGSFCGTRNAGGTKPLRLGGVSVVMVLAYCVERSDWRQFEDLWRRMSPKTAERRFLSDSRPESTRLAVMALWWFFRKAFAKDKHDGRIVRLETNSDGVRVDFNWSTARLFEEAKSLVGSTALPSRAAISVAEAYPVPRNTAEALAWALAALSFEPGRLLACHSGITVQAVSEA